MKICGGFGLHSIKLHRGAAQERSWAGRSGSSLTLIFATTCGFSLRTEKLPEYNDCNNVEIK